MTREDIKQALLEEKHVHFNVWTWGIKTMTCSEGCCDDYFRDIGEALDCIEFCTDGNWGKVRIL